MLPTGLQNAYLFSGFNALSFQIVLGAPMVLYARSLDASATVLGIIAGMMPLLVIFQIPAANYVERVGYRRFVLAGWSIRVLHIFGMALVPLTTPFLESTARLALLLALLFGFNLSRGISSCAWLPWITGLVPEAIRGRFLSREAAWVNLASLATFLLAALSLGGTSRPWQFSVVFLFSAVTGAISLVFLKRIPDLPLPPSGATSRAPVPYAAMIRFAPFRRLLDLALVWSLAYGGMTVFTIAFLKGPIGLSESRTLLISSVAFVGGYTSLIGLGSQVDRWGSRPILLASLVTWLGVLGGWIVLAGHWAKPHLGLVLGLEFLMGLGAALVHMANTRLAMAVIPAMGRSHFFAIYSVASNLVLGLSPILWGILIDALAQVRWVWWGFEWNQFSVFFVLVAAAFTASLLLARRLEEPACASMEQMLRELLIQSPQRFWLRFWPRG
jgi:MFS family permease